MLVVRQHPGRKGCYLLLVGGKPSEVPFHDRRDRWAGLNVCWGDTKLLLCLCIAYAEDCCQVLLCVREVNQVLGGLASGMCARKRLCYESALGTPFRQRLDLRTKGVSAPSVHPGYSYTMCELGTAISQVAAGHLAALCLLRL